MSRGNEGNRDIRDVRPLLCYGNCGGYILQHDKPPVNSYICIDKF